MNQATEAILRRLMDEVKLSSMGELSLPMRKILWNALTEKEAASEKRLILTNLDIVCVQHASFMWSEKIGNLQAISTMLAVALDAAGGVIPIAEALRKRDDFCVEIVEDRDYEAQEYPVMFVGHAAANTIATAISDFTYDSSDLRHDRDLDPEDYEPSYLIASAFAGGLDEKGNSNRRREFWQWYLSDAIREVV